MAVELGSAHGVITIDSRGVTTGTQQATSSLEKFTSGFGKFSSSVVKISGGIAAEIKLLQKAFEFGEAGANLDYTREKFNRMAAAMGTSGDELLAKLQEVTRGMVSNSELVESALNFMSLGLVKTEDQAVRLTKVAGALGMNMNQLVLTLTNQTTMRFDALGVAVDGFDDKVQALKRSGLDANAAFSEAFLQQAEEQIAKVGEVADSSVAPFKRLEVASKNLGDAIQTKLAGPLANAAEAAALLLDWNNRINQAYDEQLERVGASARTYDEYARAVLDAAVAAKKLNSNQRDVALQARAVEGTYGDLLTSVDGLTEAQWRAAKSDEELIQRYGDWSESMAIVQSATDEATASLEAQKMTLDEMNLFMKGELGNEISSFVEKQGDLRDKADAYKQTIDELTKKPYLTAEQRQQLEETKQKYAEIQEQIKANAEEHDRATKQILLNLLAQQLAESDAAAILPVLAEKWGLIDQATADAYGTIQYLIQQYKDGKITLSELVALMDNLKDKTVTVTVKGKVDPILNNVLSTQDSARTPTGGTQLTPRAIGGPVYAGRAYRWQESNSRLGEALLTMRNGTVLTSDQVDKLLTGGTQDMSAQVANLSRAVETLSGQPPVQINVSGTVRSDEDLEALAYRTSDLVVSRLRGR